MRTLVLGLALAASYGPALAAETIEPREAFASRWRGAWVVTKAPTASECNGIYTDNWVSGATVQARGRQRFEPGIPARVDQVMVTSSRVTLSMTLSERLYVTSPRREYTLVNTASCQVDLKITVPPGLAAEGDLLALESLLAPVAERHASEQQAIIASGFLPVDEPGYEQARQAAIVAHNEWKAAESAEAIEARLREWNARNARISSQISDDPDYMAGFVRGVETGRAAPPLACADLVQAAPAPYWPSATSAAHAAKGRRQKAWARGYEDGARLSQGLEAVKALQACTAPGGGGAGTAGAAGTAGTAGR